MATDGAATPGGDPEEWVYLGPHWRTDSMLAWRDPDGETLGFKKVRARLFGGIYTVSVQRTEDIITVYGTPTWTGRHAEDSAEIQARATKRETRLQEQRLERNTSRTATIDAALTDLLDLAAPMTTDARRVLLEYITAKVYATKRPAGPAGRGSPTPVKN